MNRPFTHPKFPYLPVMEMHMPDSFALLRVVFAHSSQRIKSVGRLWICLLAIPMLFLNSCQLDVQDVIIPHHEIPDTSNLICNPSFELDGHGSLECWRIVKDFTTYPDTFVQIAPPGGGQFSLRLEGYRDVAWDPYVETFVTNLTGTRNLTLTAEVMAIGGGQAIELWLKHIRNGQVIDSTVDVHWAFNDWLQFRVTDTLTLLPQDSLQIKILQNTGQNSLCYVDWVVLR